MRTSQGVDNALDNGTSFHKVTFSPGKSENKTRSCYKAPVSFSVVFAILLIVRDIVGISVPAIWFTIAAGLAFILMKRNQAFMFLMFTFPLTGTPSLEIVSVYVIVSVIKDRAALSRGSIPVMLLACVMVLIEAVDVTVFGNLSIGAIAYSVFKTGIYLLIPVIWCNQNFDSGSICHAGLFFCCGVLLGALLAFFMCIQAYGIMALFQGTVRLGVVRVAGVISTGMTTEYNPNRLALFLDLSIAVVVFAKQRNACGNAFTICFLVFSVLFVFLTESRAGILALFLIVILNMLFSDAKRIPIFGKIFFIMLLVAGILIVLLSPGGLFDTTLARFQTEDNGGYRWEFFLEYLQIWQSSAWSVLFGLGVSTYFQMGGYIASAHNMLEEILVSWGIVGFLCMIAYYFLLCRSVRGKQGTKARGKSWIPFIVFFFLLQAGQFLSAPVSVALLAYTLLLLKEPQEHISQDDEARSLSQLSMR